jgi:acyl carrier protein phosphodiesterase
LNLLGHLYLSQNESAESRLYNLLGDRYKGNSFEQLSAEAQKGIRMHRFIDNFMDQHGAVKALKAKISNSLPKVSGIALDVFFDYLLASEWQRFHRNELDLFLNSFFESIQGPIEKVPIEHTLWIDGLNKNRYIHQYKQFESVVAISEHLHRKLKFKTEIYRSPIIFSTFESEIRDVFEEYIKDARENFGIS